MKDELNFESLLAELGENTSSIVSGGFRFTELKMSDQRKIMNMSFNPIEIPARVAIIFNEYIKNSVAFEGDMVDVSSFITVDVKPFILTQLRILTLGDTYVDRQTKKVYKIKPIEEADLVTTIEPGFVEFNNMIIRFCVPTINKETSINNQLLLELGKFKKNLSEEDYGKVSDTYQVYEIFKYVTTIESNGKVFDFSNCPTNKKMKIINNLPHKVVMLINDYIEKSREKSEEKIVAIIPETNEQIKLDVSTIFFENTARVSNND
jgi:hypothetical protein